MIECRYGSYAHAYEPTLDKIYIIGGNNQGQKDECEYYDVNKDKWTEFAKLPEPLSTMSASILNNKFIYLFCGL